MAVFDDVRATGKLLIYDQGVEFVNGEPVARKSEGVAEPLSDAEPLRRQSEVFLECIRTRNQPLTDGESGLRVLRVLDAAERSLAAGGTPERIQDSGSRIQGPLATAHGTDHTSSS